MIKQQIQSSKGVVNWKQDLQTLARELSHRHKNLFYNRNREDMEQDILALEKQIPFLNDYEILVALIKWVASAGDAHTRINWVPSRVYPLALYWFKEGIYVTNTAPEYSFLLHEQLEEVAGQSISSVIERLRPLIPHENQSQLKAEIPRKLISPEILYGVGLASHFGEITYNFRTTRGSKISATLRPCTPDNPEQFFAAGPMGLGGSPYEQNKQLSYWFEYLETYKALYFQYNHCQEDFTFPHQRLIKTLVTTLEEKQVKKLVIDLRYNQGGDSLFLQPFVDMLPKLKSRNCFDKLYVIIGRATFSSGLLHAINLRVKAGAMLLGEPTGGRPNHFGEVRVFQLPNSGVSVSYSTKFFYHSRKDRPSLNPDLVFPVSFVGYLANRDPVMEYVLGQ